MQIQVPGSNLGFASSNPPLEEGHYMARIGGVQDMPDEGKGASAKIVIEFLKDGKIIPRTYYFAYNFDKLKDFPRRIANSFLRHVGGVPEQQIVQGGYIVDPLQWVGRQFYCYYRPGEEKVVEGKTERGLDTKIPCSQEEYQRNISAASAGTGFQAPAGGAPAGGGGGGQMAAPQQQMAAPQQQMAAPPQQAAGGFGQPAGGGFGQPNGQPAAGGFGQPAGGGFGFPNMNAGR